ncbi:hypothetical protein CNMCM7691_006353 [Aspergillus felis]|uniref:LysM domain-containing protein n=2 Tax=Aspergillus felis TaxID=1287682 RepID=A0A8H6QTX9_9EURO|nr:hypothetical protein CNMCM7691_006353 [Aspergillus felis]
MALLSSLAFAVFALAVPHVAPRQASNTTHYYTVLEGDSIFSIAAKLDRGVCDIARANRMMDAEYLFPGFSLIIPDAVSNPDNDTCLLQAQNATATCIYGGPHDYTTATNDTITRVALYKLNITVDSLWTENAKIFNLSSPDEVLPPNSYLKVPQCMPSVCTITAFEFTYGVFKDLAEKYGTTVGQIMTLNFHYNYSSAVGTAADEALGLSYPIITLPVGCKALVDSPSSNL